MTSMAVSKRRLARSATALLIWGVSSAVHAQVRVDGACARPTVPSQSATGVFMRLTAERDVVLTGLSSPVAGVVQVHEMSMDKDIMRMRPVDQLALKAGQTIELKSGGLHIMMMELKMQIKVGEVVPLTLSFRSADGSMSTVEAKATAGFTPPAR